MGPFAQTAIALFSQPTALGTTVSRASCAGFDDTRPARVGAGARQSSSPEFREQGAGPGSLGYAEVGVKVQRTASVLACPPGVA